MSIDLYTTLEEAKEETQKRSKDKYLTKKLYEYCKGNIPDILTSEPRSILWRHVISPDNEFEAYLKKAGELGIKPLGLEFHSDIYVSANKGKVGLGKMVFYEGKDKDGKAFTSSLHSIDLSGLNEKKRFKDIKCLWGENFVDFHHRILRKRYDVELYDCSSLLAEWGGGAKVFYKHLIASATIKNVMFENYEDVKESRFFLETVIPAIECVEKEFGLKPLIIPIAPPADAENIYWWSYPESVKALIKRD